MTRVFKWIGIVLGSLVVLLAAFLATTYVIANNRMNREYTVTVPAVALPTDAASIQEGARLTVARGCTDCHGADLGGQVMIDDFMFARLASTNLTTGRGGVGTRYDAEDYARAVWYGLRPDGTALAFMPSHEYHQGLDPAHLGKILAYIQTVPAVDREAPARRLGPMGWTFYALGQLPIFPVDAIDLSEPPPSNTPIEATAAYGETIGVLCSGCHGPGLAGAVEGGDVVPNLTMHPTGLAGWTLDDFKTALRTGVRPDGTTISEAMPWRNLGQMTDVEFEALWAYLSSLDPQPAVGQN